MSPSTTDAGGSGRISEEEAVVLARNAVEGLAEIHEGEPVRVEFTDDRCVVTFEHVVPPTELGADFDAQVTLDATTGEVMGILGGP